MVQFGPLNFCRTILVSSCGLKKVPIIAAFHFMTRRLKSKAGDSSGNHFFCFYSFFFAIGEGFSRLLSRSNLLGNDSQTNSQEHEHMFRRLPKTFGGIFTFDAFLAKISLVKCNQEVEMIQSRT